MEALTQHLRTVKARAAAWSTPVHRQALAEAYLPIVRGFLLPGSAYYLFVTFGHFQDESGRNLLILAGISALTAIAYHLIRQHALTLERLTAGRLEFACIVTNLLMYSNVLAYMLLHFEESKLIYFVLMAAVFSVSGVTLRVTITTVSLSIVTLYLLASAHLTADAFRQYVFIGVAASFAAFGMATLLRLAILRQIDARLLANRLEAEARDLSRTDTLTGIPNRRAVFDVLDVLVAGRRPFWLGVLDLDGFKLINDIYGHVTGDTLLRAVVARVRDGIGRREVVFGRLGGDEFALIVEGAPVEAEVQALMAPVTAGLSAPFSISQRNMQIGMSTGFAHFPSMSTDSGQLYEMADYALYKAKAGRRGRVLAFSAADAAEMGDNIAVERALRDGSLEDELRLVFQPQYSLAERRIVGFEALARWSSPTLGDVRPDRFIRAAERSGMMHAVTAILFEKLLATLADFPPALSLSFNLSALDVVDRAFALSLVDRINHHGVDHRRIEFEITETAVMTDFDTARAALEGLSATGCRIALDDFGAGQSSLLYLDQLPLDKVKIDKGFVERIGASPTSREIVRSVIDLCRRLDLRCVLEGVETEEELAVLAPMRPDIIQGYLFGRPEPLDRALAALLRDAVAPRSPEIAGGEAPTEARLGGVRR